MFSTSVRSFIASMHVLTHTPIEIAVYKVGDKYLGARSNEFGYANYEIIQAPKEVSPLR